MNRHKSIPKLEFLPLAPQSIGTSFLKNQTRGNAFMIF